MKISKEHAEDIMEGDFPEGYEKVEVFHIEETRWGNKWRVIFKASDGNTYGLDYEIGSGESDYTSADVEWGEEVECPEYIAEPVTTINWVKAPDQ